MITSQVIQNIESRVIKEIADPFFAADLSIKDPDQYD